MSKTAEKVTSKDQLGSGFVVLFENIYNQSGLTFEQAICLSNNSSAFGLDISAAIRKHSGGDQFAEEEIESKYGYLSGYRAPVDFKSQIDILRNYWPNLNPDLAISYANRLCQDTQFLSPAEGLFAIIRPEFFSNNYGEETTEVLKALCEGLNGSFSNYLDRQLGSKYLAQKSKTTSALASLTKQQNGSDILVLYAQFGMGHRGRSARRAEEKFGLAEFGLGLRDVATMLLTNPIRLQGYNDLWMNLAGDSYSAKGNRSYSDVVCMRLDDDEIQVDTHGIEVFGAGYGVPSGFLK